MITTKKEHILNNNSHEFHIFWVVIMPNIPNYYIVALARDTDDFCEVLELFQGDIDALSDKREKWNWKGQVIFWGRSNVIGLGFGVNWR